MGGGLFDAAENALFVDGECREGLRVVAEGFGCSEGGVDGFVVGVEIAVTFVVFPLVSRSTFTDDRETTKRYIQVTLRYSLIFATAIGVVMARQTWMIAMRRLSRASASSGKSSRRRLGPDHSV